MSKRNESELLLDILEASRRILSYTNGLDYNHFVSDNKTQDSVIRNIEIIGEASKKLSVDFRKTHPQVEWKIIAAMRDRLIHDYFGANIDIVWGVVSEDIPTLIEKIKIILSADTAC